MNKGGRLYEFRVRIEDQNRTSLWVVAKAFIAAANGNECVEMDMPERGTMMRNISSQFRYPLVQYLKITQNCPDVTFEYFNYQYTMLNSTRNQSRAL